MYHSSFFDDVDDDDFFKKFSSSNTKYYSRGLNTMEIVTIVCSVIGIAVVLVLLCRCCRRRNQGRILSPPPPQPPGPVLQPPYPQQQFIHTAYPVSVPPPTGYPAYGAPYPALPLPGAGAGTVLVAAPAPAPAPAPTAPDLTAFYGIPPPGWNTQALPPSYEQATGVDMKQSPYNPAHPH